MAFNIIQKNKDENPQKQGLGISLASNNGEIFSSTYTTKDTIKERLLNWFNTENYERVMNISPVVGGSIMSYVFENISSNTLELIDQYIRSRMSEYFPQIEVTDLEIRSSPDYKKIQIIISYNILNTGISDSLVLNPTLPENE